MENNENEDSLKTSINLFAWKNELFHLMREKERFAKLKSSCGWDCDYQIVINKMEENIKNTGLKLVTLIQSNGGWVERWVKVQLELE